MFDLDLTDPQFAGGTFYMTVAVLNNVRGWEWLQLQFHALNGECEGNTTWAEPRSSAILYIETDDSRVVLNELAAGAKYCVGVRAATKASDPATTYIRRPNSGVIPIMRSSRRRSASPPEKGDVMCTTPDRPHEEQDHIVDAVERRRHRRNRRIIATGIVGALGLVLAGVWAVSIVTTSPRDGSQSAADLFVGAPPTGDVSVLGDFNRPPARQPAHHRLRGALGQHSR